jgi:nitrite reductase (NAD(P)H)
MCPHKRAFILSDGLIGEDPDDGTEEGRKKRKMWVSCPYHKRNFQLNGGEAAGSCSNDEEINIATFPVEERDDGWVYLKLPPVAELDAVLGTEKWKVRKEESEDCFKELDRKMATKGRKSVKPAEINGNGSGGSKGLDW